MSDIEKIKLGEDAVDSLFHYGVPGMKWGVRREDRASRHRETSERNQRIADGTASRKDKIDQAVWGKGMKGGGGPLSLTKPVAARLAKHYGKKADKLDAKVEAKSKRDATKAAYQAWKKEANGTEMANKAFQQAAKDFEKTAEIINNDPNYKGKDLTKGLLAKQYQATMNHYFNQHLAEASVDLTYNPQYERAMIYQYDDRTGMMKGVEHKLVYDKVQHDALSDDFQLPDYNVELDDLGHMIGFSPAGELKHYGVKGMKWGVRKDDRTSGSSGKDVVVTQKRAGTYAKAKGGQRQVVTDDAAKSLAARQKAKASTTDALTNQELRVAVERMNLEMQYKRLEFESDRRSKGKKFVAGLLGKKKYGSKEKMRYRDGYEDLGENVGKVLKASRTVKKVVAG